MNERKQNYYHVFEKEFWNLIHFVLFAYIYYVWNYFHIDSCLLSWPYEQA